MTKKNEIKKHHEMHFAGHVWTFNKVVFTRDAEDYLGISMAELTKMHRAVANAICGSDEALTADELDFLCSLTSTTNRDIADLLKCTPTNVSKWRKKKEVPALESLVLKEFFWEKVFGKDIDYPRASFGAERLKNMKRTAIKLKLADPIEKAA